jgi:cephalosporin hydroxylase
VKIIYDEERAIVTRIEGTKEETFPLTTPEAFEALSRAWLRASWDVKYPYAFSWMGRPIIQLPEDMIRIQEVIWDIKPDVIIETGVAHGGSLIFYNSLLKAMGKTDARVIGIEIDLRAHNEAALKAHPLFDGIEIFKGSSVDPEVVSQVAAIIRPGATTLIILDSNHTHSHVMAELEAYAPLVSVGSYIVATDGIMELVVGGPRTKPEWKHDNPKQAAIDFVATHPDFAVSEPAWPFNEGVVRERITYWPGAFVKRQR